MTNTKQIIVTVLRQLRLLRLFDSLKYSIDLKRNRLSNKAFIENHPEFRVPPFELAYDAYGHTNWDAYYHTGREHAKYISDLIKENIVSQAMAICEWGCGPARIIRHIPQFFEDPSIRLYGFDYNHRTIQWCRENIENIIFNHNLLTPPLAQDSSSFDCLYCVSVFTHLSRKMHFEWIKEISRVVKPDGIIILTTHGDLTKANLLKHEILKYDEGNLLSGIRSRKEYGLSLRTTRLLLSGMNCSRI